MAPLKPIADPYRILGVAQGADRVQIKAAHRRLAKLYHPDGASGDEGRFLAVQEAYQLLADPLRRREWDQRHAPGPVRAHDPASRAAQGPTSRAARGAPPTGPSSTGTGATRSKRASAPGRRSRTWSAERVPWWQEFRPRGRPDAAAAEDDSAGPGPDHDPTPHAAGEGTTAPGLDFDVFSRSSGAAWSMAARRHFRRGDDELPSRGAWRYRGTQVVTGAEARKVAAEEAAQRAAAEGAAAAKRAAGEASAERTAAERAAAADPNPPPRRRRRA